MTRDGRHYEVDQSICNQIHVMEDGLDVSILDRSTKTIENPAARINMIDYAVKLLSSGQNWGWRQKNALETAIERALYDENESEMSAIKKHLRDENDKYSSDILACLKGIIEGNYLRKSEKKLEPQKLNIVSFEGINPDT